MGRCFIYGAGEYFGGLPETGDEDLIIAADGGYGYLEENGVVPIITIGDFDSLKRQPGSLRGKVTVLPVDKDDTDTGAAVKTGLSLGYTVFHIYGGTGGRPDHTFANIQLLAYLAERGAEGYLFGRDTVMTAVKNGGIIFPAGQTGTVSVFSLSERSTGVTERGLRYTLQEAELTGSWPLGVSNSLTGDEAEISVKKGTLLVIFPGSATFRREKYNEDDALPEG